MRRTLPIVWLVVWLAAPPFPSALAQNAAITVTIRLGDLKTECYPACDHSTEWLQQLYAEVRDTTGMLLPSTNLQFDWGVDYCAGLGYQNGFAAGVGLDHIAVDGNLLKNAPDCCPACEFQAYDVGVRVRHVDEWVQSPRVRVPNIFIPAEHALLPNYPNPFNASTVIPFDVHERSRVQLDVLDVSGRLVARLVDRTFAAGRHAIPWSPDASPSGAYLCRLRVETDGGTVSLISRRMVLVR